MKRCPASNSTVSTRAVPNSAGPTRIGNGPASSRAGRVAMLMAMTVLMLLTMFMAEMFFSTGLELRSMATYREGQQARGMARSVLRVVQIGLLMDEAEFFKGSRQVAQLLDGGVSLPWDDGLLISLKIEPQDHLYNLNQRGDIQQGEQNDIARGLLFMNMLRDLDVPGALPDSPSESITE